MSFKIFIILGFIALTYGCGFHPLYEDQGTKKSVVNELSSIEIKPIPDRLGQQVHNYLLDRISPLGRPESPLYSLYVDLSLSKQNLGVKGDDTSTRAKLVLSASYRLLDEKSDKKLFQSSTQTANSFTIVNIKSDFANLSSENDAIDRAAREISDSIRSRIALYFATRSHRERSQ